jgi:transcriptional regulator with XRE-family HTH domain
MQRHGKPRPTPEKIFGGILRELRQERGISQEALSFECGVHRTYIGLLERGRMNPSLKTLLSIASALGVPADDLVARVEAELGKGWKREPGTRKPSPRER